MESLRSSPPKESSSLRRALKLSLLALKLLSLKLEFNNFVTVYWRGLSFYCLYMIKTVLIFK